MNLLLDVIYIFNIFGYSIYLGLSMGVCRCNGQSYINEGQWLEPQEPLKRVVANKVVEGSIVYMLNIWRNFKPCTWMLGVAHLQDMHNHGIDHLCLPMCLGVEGNQFGHVGVH
jgi:hypothetical protein